MRKTLYILIILLSSGQLVAQVSDTTRYFMFGLEYGDLYSASSMIANPVGGEERFLGLEQMRIPGIMLSKISNGYADYLAMRLALLSNRQEEEVPLLGNFSDTIPGQFVTDVTRRRATLFDLEVGKLRVKSIGPVNLAYGAGIYVTLGSASEELRTSNNLEGYIGRTISTETRLRGTAGIRPRLELQAPLYKQFSLSIGGTYQVGFVTLPDVESRNVAYVITDPEPQIIQETEDLTDISWRSSDTIDFWFRIDFKLRP